MSVVLNRARRAAARAFVGTERKLDDLAKGFDRGVSRTYDLFSRAKRLLRGGAKAIDVESHCEDCCRPFKRCLLSNDLLCFGCELARSSAEAMAADAESLAPEETTL